MSTFMILDLNCSFCTVCTTYLNIVHNLYITGLPLTEDNLREVAELSGLLDVSEDFLTPEFRAECERIIPDRENIKPNECKDVFLYLKDNFRL